MPFRLDLKGLRFAAPGFLPLLWVPALLILWVLASVAAHDVRAMRRTGRCPSTSASVLERAAVLAVPLDLR